MDKSFQLFSFLCAYAISLHSCLAQVVSDVKQDSESGNLNDGQMPSQLALCILCTSFTR